MKPNNKPKLHKGNAKVHIVYGEKGGIKRCKYCLAFIWDFFPRCPNCGKKCEWVASLKV